MAEERSATLEAALAALERDVEATARAATAAGRAVKALQKAVKQGELRKLTSALGAADQAVKALSQQFANTEDGWSFDVETHLASGAFAKELIRSARQQGVSIFEQDERLYCYPSLLRVLPAEQCVKIDRDREARLRPSVLTAHLKAIQQRPPRFRPEAFLESLHEAYVKLNPKERGTLAAAPRVIKLLDVYNLLTILPGQSREYTKAEFARDIYLLDRSGVTRTRGNAVMTLVDAATASRSSTATIPVITESGRQRVYFGIRFDAST